MLSRIYFCYQSSSNHFSGWRKQKGDYVALARTGNLLSQTHYAEFDNTDFPNFTVIHERVRTEPESIIMKPKAAGDLLQFGTLSN